MNDISRAPSTTGSKQPRSGDSAFRAYRRLLGYVAPYRGRFILGLLGGALFAASMASAAFFAKKFGDGTLVHQDPRTIIWVPLALVALFTLRGIGDFVQTYFMGSVGRQVVSQLRHDVFRHILELPVGYLDRSSSAALLSRLTYNSEQVAQAVTDSIVSAIRNTLTIIGSLGFLLWLNARLTLVAFLSLIHI